MEILLIPGLILWSAVAFFGSRSAFAAGRMPAALERIRAGAPAVLMLLAVVGFAGGLALAVAEIAAIRAREGEIGGLFGLAVVAGMVGAVCLSALLSRGSPRPR